MCLQTAGRLTVGQDVVLELHPPGSPLIFTVYGVVVTVDREGQGMARASVRFTRKQIRSER